MILIHNLTFSIKTLKMNWLRKVGGEMLLSFIPDKFKTREMCERAVKDDIFNFYIVPETFISREIKDMLMAFFKKKNLKIFVINMLKNIHLIFKSQKNF